MSQRLIPLIVDNEHVKGSGVNVGAAGSHDAVVLELSFSEMWRGLTKRILWIDSLGAGDAETILTPAMAVDPDTYHVTIPAAPLEHAGKMSMTISGVYLRETDGDPIESVKCVTEAAFFRVMESYLDASSQSDITPTLADQLQDEIDDLQEQIDNLSPGGLTFDETPTAGSTNPVTSRGIKTAIDSITPPSITLDNVPTAGSDNPVKSQGIKSWTENLLAAAVYASIGGAY